MKILLGKKCLWQLLVLKNGITYFVGKIVNKLCTAFPKLTRGKLKRSKQDLKVSMYFSMLY